jgi:hypothetical protein
MRVHRRAICDIPRGCAVAAVDHRIVERLGVPARDPDVGLLDDAGVEADDLDRLAALQAVRGRSALGGDGAFCACH